LNGERPASHLGGLIHRLINGASVRAFNLCSINREEIMFAIMGVTGNVGGAVARRLLATGRQVRAVVRNAQKGAAWAERGCAVSVADLADQAALTAAFAGAEGVFVMVPPVFDPTPGFPEARAIAAGLKAAIEAARPGKVVYLSTIGAQAATPMNLLTQHTMIEAALRSVPLPVTFLRPGWFFENSVWDVAAARAGVIPSFLQPLDKPVPMIATEDIGRLAAELIEETWTGSRVVELEAARRVTPNEIAETFAKILGHPVRTEAVPRDSWEELFRSQGMKNPLPRIQMVDGFNAEWIRFEGEPRKGEVGLETVLRRLVEQAG
jgi:NAD(P)H dehydrogenase (quinone)